MREVGVDSAPYAGAAMRACRWLCVLLAQLALVACSSGGVKSPDQATFTLAGQLSGLASGATLVLSDGAGSNLTLTQNGGFQFTGEVPFGASYDVTVATQPSGQSCTVAGSASSTAIEANVTNLTVTCGAPQFTIGGTLSGLPAGASVVLEDNGGNPLTLTGNGNFTFTQTVAYGQAYSVTVETQPTGQTCSVADNTGARSGINQNITDVQVVCSSTAYTIGGTLIGLDSGSSVTLYDNGADSLTLKTNGSFTFATPVAYGGSYQVIIATQPVGESCSIANSSGSGIGVSANITSVAIVCSNNTFTIGGAVIGLATGQSVTLLDNGADALTVTANGGFTFATAIAYGGSYAATVSAQPTGQTCSITNASQSDVTSAVNDVTVTCTSSTYTVGGTISGLASSASVTLLDNGSDALTVSADGSFTFGAAVAAGNPYDVSVAREPTGQTCAVSAGSGTVSASDITTVSVSCSTSSSSGPSSGSYTVGGTVTGLTAGASLVLRNSSDGDTVLVSSSGSFAFPTGQASGASYAASVEEESSGLSCTVSGADGIVGTADVTSIAVTCASSGTSSPPSSYSVGGTVSGLPTGATLVLSNSLDGDTVSVSASGAFAFPTAQPSGASYNTVIEMQPATATCAVSNGSGTVGSSDVTSIAVTCTAATGAAVYTIGGSTVGLPQGESVVLTDSGNNDAVTVTANGIYTFPTSEPSGYAYDVTVETAPSGETCTVSGGQGYIGVTNVTSVLVSCSSSSTTYTVGGTVAWGSGASGTLTVSLGGTNLVTVTSPASTFTFPTALAAGSNYVATITAEPSGSLCYIASGAAGYAIAANVTGIAIDCSQQITVYPMTVTVNDLPSSDEVYLTLTGSTGTTTTPFTGGTTTWPTDLTGGAQYSLSVQSVYNTSTSSDDAGTTCSVSDGSFTVNGDVTETVTCAAVSDSFTIGGTVTGLPTSSTQTPYTVTLLETSGNDYVTVEGACTSGSSTCSTSPSDMFTFPDSVANGASYTVTVATQPALGTTTCTVANGTGVVNGANVTNVEVTCPAATWSVGGTVSGLPSGGSVALEDTDSGNTLTVTNSSADAAYPAFTIDSSDATTASYNVEVTSSPANYTCTVTNGSGTVPAVSNGSESNVENIDVSCSPNPVYVSGTVTWNNTQSTATAAVSATLLLNGQYAVTSGVSSVGAAVDSTDGTANSTFAFSQALTSGTAWAVSVQTVTSGWTCQLTNASGSSITANVTNVQVTCTN